MITFLGVYKVFGEKTSFKQNLFQPFKEIGNYCSYVKYVNIRRNIVKYQFVIGVYSVN